LKNLKTLIAGHPFFLAAHKGVGKIEVAFFIKVPIIGLFNFLPQYIEETRAVKSGWEHQWCISFGYLSITSS